jgi:hypothetical protein
VEISMVTIKYMTPINTENPGITAYSLADIFLIPLPFIALSFHWHLRMFCILLMDVLNAE